MSSLPTVASLIFVLVSLNVGSPSETKMMNVALSDSTAISLASLNACSQFVPPPGVVALTAAVNSDFVDVRFCATVAAFENVTKPMRIRLSP